jgi:nucleoside-diphosphate-sugar epimerase
MNVLIGSRGTVGRSILDQVDVDLVFNSDNIACLTNQLIDTVYLAAPSGNRFAINQNRGRDEDDFLQIKKSLSQCKVKQIVFISSVDAVVAPNSRYGCNRLNMESWIRDNHFNYYIIRLSTLIGQHIKKNIIFDLKNKQYIDQIDHGAKIQWCVLDTLVDQINQATQNNQREINLVSQPIANWEIVQEFFPEWYREPTESHVFYDQQPYWYTRKQIFNAIRQYLR